MRSPILTASRRARSTAIATRAFTCRWSKRAARAASIATQAQSVSDGALQNTAAAVWSAVRARLTRAPTRRTSATSATAGVSGSCQWSIRAMAQRARREHGDEGTNRGARREDSRAHHQARGGSLSMIICVPSMRM
jgi:hypothetical protein